MIELLQKLIKDNEGNMKRFLLLIPVTLLPYILLFALYSLFINQYIVEKFFGSNALWLLFMIFAATVISFICTLVYMPLCLAKGWSARQTAFFNMLIKLIHIPAYLVIFVLGVLFFITIFTYAFSIFFVIFDCMTIFITGLIGLTANLRLYKEKKCTGSFAAINSICQFLFCIDVINAVIVYIRSRKEPVRQNTFYTNSIQ